MRWEPAPWAQGRGRMLLAVVVVLAVALTACGDDDKDSAGGGAASTSQAATGDAGGKCGTVPGELAADPDGVLAELPQELQEGYRGFGEVSASKWTEWQPEGEPPYTVGVSVPNSDTPFTQVFLETLRSKAGTGLTGDVKIASARNDLQTQLQQLEGFIRDKVDLLIVLPLSSEAVAPAYEAAGKAGIPVVSALSPAPNENAVGVLTSLYLNGALTAGRLGEIVGGEGKVLMVHGIPNTPGDELVQQGAKDAFALCPDIEPIGDVVGQYAPPVAKAETLKYLAANPAPLAGVVQSGTMAGGVIQAFEQAGREVPVVTAISADPGALAWWNEHKAEYEGVGTGNGLVQLSTGVWNVAQRMLAGNGVKVRDVVQSPPLITNDNVADWVEPDWTPQTLGSAEGPPDALFSPEFLDAFFVKPGSPDA